MINKRFGKLIVKSKSHSDNGIVWNCICDCGNNTTARTGHLNAGSTISCGCALKENRDMFKSERFKHGLTNHPLFNVWQDMIRRCYSEYRDDFKNYGGRGIRVCYKWRGDFRNFLDDMGECPKGYTLERIDTNGDYFKDNCKWATRAEQNRNSRFSKWWHIRGRVFESASRAGKYFGVTHSTIINWCKSNNSDCFSELKYR